MDFMYHDRQLILERLIPPMRERVLDLCLRRFSIYSFSVTLLSDCAEITKSYLMSFCFYLCLRAVLGHCTLGIRCGQFIGSTIEIHRVLTQHGIYELFAYEFHCTCFVASCTLLAVSIES